MRQPSSYGLDGKSDETIAKAAERQNNSDDEDIEIEKLIKTSTYIYSDKHHEYESYPKKVHQLKKFQSAVNLTQGVTNNFSSANTNFDSDTLSNGGLSSADPL